MGNHKLVRSTMRPIGWRPWESVRGAQWSRRGDWSQCCAGVVDEVLGSDEVPALCGDEEKEADGCGNDMQA